jgi:hypothetical protein
MTYEYNPLPNVLNKYRSFTYVFTLSAVDSVSANNGRYRNKSFESSIILRSGGKGSKKIFAPSKLSPVQLAKATENYQKTNYDPLQIDSTYLSKEDINDRITNDEIENIKAIVEGFNKESSGRYDFFIDSAEITGIITPRSKTGMSMAQNISFSVVEPYSINGFLEALHVSAVSAGYLGYNNAKFLLKIEFLGYNENDVPEKIDSATKYCLIYFRNVKIEIKREGTKYLCEAVAVQDIAFGNASVLKKNTSGEGSKVGDILRSLFDNINNQIKTSDKEAVASQSKFHDQYEIRFDNTEEIEKSDIFDFKSNNSVTVMPEIFDYTNEEELLEQQGRFDEMGNFVVPRGAKVKINFNQNRTITQCIESVIVDSDYIRNILYDVQKNIDRYGMVDYFIIKTLVEDLSDINPQTNDFYKKYIFVVTKYKIHVTKIPNYQNLINISNKLKPLILKEYNYTYTGKNIDVLDFKIDFNSLFYAAVPYALGNNNKLGTSNSIGPNNDVKVKVNESDRKTLLKNQVGVIPSRTVSSEIQPSQGSGNILQDSPFSILSRNFHDAVVNGQVNGVSGELEILGEPLFLSGNVGTNEIVKNDSNRPNLTVYGDIDPYWGEVYIQINFRNPVDLNKFSTLKVPFSGIYGIRQIKSTFSDGLFKQTLDIYRIHSQIFDTSVEMSPSNVIVTYPDPIEVSQPNTSPALEVEGPRADPLKVNIPKVNNPVNNILGKLTTDVSQGISQLSQFSSVFSNAVNKISSGVKGISDKLSTSMSPTAQVVTADKTLKSVIANANSAADTFAESVKDSPLAKFNPKADDPLVNSLVTVKNLVVGYAEDFKKSGTLDKLKSYGSSLETSFKGIENKLRETKSEDVAKALGINVEKLDRINEIKLSQLKETSEKLTLNLAASLKNGLRLENVPADKFLNIPTTAPDTKAPEPVVLNMDLINQNLERAFGVNSKDKIPGFVPPQLINDLKGSAKQFAQAIESSRPQIEADVVAFKGKMESVTVQIKNATGKFQQSAESFKSNLNELSNKVAINLYGNKSSESPLDKIINS